MRFLAVFPREQVHFVLLEALAESPEITLNELLDFLNLAHSPAAMRTTAYNVSPAAKLPTLDKEQLRSLTREFLPVVVNLERQTGLSLARRWGFHTD